MNNRIKKLRDQTLSAVPSLSIERAVLMTDFNLYAQSERF
jgi:hypothetical protein